MRRERFEQLVEEALGGLPQEFAQRLDNVAVDVEDFATREQLERAGLKDPHQLLGIYEGVPLTKRYRGYYGALPDRITIFRVPIEALCHTDEQIREQVRRTVVHEIGHFFGMSEEELRRAGAD